MLYIYIYIIYIYTYRYMYIYIYISQLCLYVSQVFYIFLNIYIFSKVYRVSPQKCRRMDVCKSIASLLEARANSGDSVFGTLLGSIRCRRQVDPKSFKINAQIDVEQILKNGATIESINI